MLIKKVLHRLILFLSFLNFQYLWNLEKLSDQAQIFQRMFSVLISVNSLKDQ